MPDAPPDLASRDSRWGLSISRALMLGLFALLLGRLVWRVTHMVREPERIAAAPTLSAIDARGKTVALSAPPRRIVSLSPGTTEMLFALGLNGRIVADTTYCDYPPEARLLPKIGDVNTSVEKVLAQRPDLVVADVVANRSAIEALGRLHLTVFAVRPEDFRATFEVLKALGAITGQTNEANGLVRSMDARLRRVRHIVAPLPKPKVLDIVQMDPLMVVGGANFMDDIIATAGGDNIGRLAGTGWVNFSPERVIAHRPDVILTGRSGVQAVLSRAGWSHVPAVQSRAVYGLAYEAVRPGPRLVDALEEIAAFLHPAAFRRR